MNITVAYVSNVLASVSRICESGSRVVVDEEGSYFQDKTGKAYLSSTDGIRMEVTNPSKMDDITSDSNFMPAVNIPGLDYKTLNDLNTKFGDIDTYRGKYSIITIPRTRTKISDPLSFCSGVRRRPKS